MAIKTLYLPDIKNGWTILYLYQSQPNPGCEFTFTLKDGHDYDNINPYINPRGGGISQYVGLDGECILVINSNTDYIDNTWAESIIIPNSGGGQFWEEAIMQPLSLTKA
ncbi:hypothetical protein PXH59_11350 [Xenorhabdus sp. SF857]|uniref:hypothetical protein n=1 Tax=Xenorhabdus bakwenae TaxID=3026967 RepID=UPI002557E18D|nr:hypothetical protein [Xenorhabdus sp. SF857]WFQ78358.1 hypothetical protein PXH59_11350 [Xenorhabdus sp. SF857]